MSANKIQSNLVKPNKINKRVQQGSWLQDPETKISSELDKLIPNSSQGTSLKKGLSLSESNIYYKVIVIGRRRYSQKG